MSSQRMLSYSAVALHIPCYCSSPQITDEPLVSRISYLSVSSTIGLDYSLSLSCASIGEGVGLLGYADHSCLKGSVIHSQYGRF